MFIHACTYTIVDCHSWWCYLH